MYTPVYTVLWVYSKNFLAIYNRGQIGILEIFCRYGGGEEAIYIDIDTGRKLFRVAGGFEVAC